MNKSTVLYIPVGNKWFHRSTSILKAKRIPAENKGKEKSERRSRKGNTNSPKPNTQGRLLHTHHEARGNEAGFFFELGNP